MDRAPTRSKQPLRLQRGCERSRLAADLLASAYELIVPYRQQPVPAARQRTPNEGSPTPPSGSSEGVSA